MGTCEMRKNKSIRRMGKAIHLHSIPIMEIIMFIFVGPCGMQKTKSICERMDQDTLPYGQPRIMEYRSSPRLEGRNNAEVGFM